MTELVITKPDDFHIHLRDDDFLPLTVDHVSAQFARAIVMPNLRPPVTNERLATSYKNRILKHLPAGRVFEPLMTLYLTDKTTAEDILEAQASGSVYAVKYYPAGATTNSDSGVTDLSARHEIFEVLSDLGMPLLVHGEVTDSNIDIFDREKVFINEILSKVVKKFPDLKIVLEHITTAESVEFVRSSPTNVAATITAHHLLLNRNDLFKGGIRPHNYCLPVLKRESHRQSLVEAAISGDSRFFLGTDSAPHGIREKESSCGCAGIYTAHAAIELYAAVFDNVNALDKLENFSSKFGSDFYGLSPNTEKIKLVKSSYCVPEQFLFSSGAVKPLGAGELLAWRREIAPTSK